MKQATIDKIIDAISPHSAWMLSSALSAMKCDDAIGEECFEENDLSAYFQYLKDNITSSELFSHHFDLHFLRHIGQILIAEHIAPIINLVTDDLIEISDYPVELGYGILDEYLNNSCNEICKMLLLKGEWADMHSFCIKHPDA